MEYANNLRTIKLSRNDACKASSRRFIDRDQLTTDSEYIEIPKVSYTIASRLIFNTTIDVLNADWVHVGLNDYDTLELAYTDGYVANPVTAEDSKVDEIVVPREDVSLNNVEESPEENESLPVEQPKENDTDSEETIMNAEIEPANNEDESLPIEPSKEDNVEVEEENKSEAVQDEEKPKAKQYQPKFKRKK